MVKPPPIPSEVLPHIKDFYAYTIDEHKLYGSRLEVWDNCTGPGAKYPIPSWLKNETAYLKVKAYKISKARCEWMEKRDKDIENGRYGNPETIPIGEFGDSSIDDIIPDHEYSTEDEIDAEIKSCKDLKSLEKLIPKIPKLSLSKSKNDYGVHYIFIHADKKSVFIGESKISFDDAVANLKKP